MNDLGEESQSEHSGEPNQDERNLGMLCHLLALAGLLIPFGNLLGPLILWLVKKEESEFVDQAGKEALNFNITISIAFIVCAALLVILIGFILLPIVAVFWLVMTIIAAVKTSDGEQYRYPLTLHLLQ